MRRLVDIAVFSVGRQDKLSDSLKEAVRHKLQEYLFRLEEGETLDELEQSERRTDGS
jgi:hypothetical protein